MRHGGQILIDQLAVNGCERIFCVPGESFLPALDGLYDHNQIATIVCRHEGGASMMAEAHGKLTGTPGIVFVTRGPGASNAVSGIFVARQDSTPVILFVGLQKRGHSDREAFQEIDLRALFGDMAKWVATITEAERIPEYVSRGFHLALSGRPGPVVLGLPEDMLHERLALDDVPAARPSYAHVSDTDVELIASALDRASRPLLIVGGANWSKTAQSQIETFAQRFQIPVGTAFRCQGHFDNRHDLYCGHFGLGIDPELSARLSTADLVCVLGPRLDEVTTGGFSHFSVPSPEQFLIHVTAAPEEAGRVYRADLPVVSSSASIADALSKLESTGADERSEWCQSARADYLAHIVPVTSPGSVKLEQIIKATSDTLKDDAIIASGAGNYTVWLHRYFQYKRFGTQLAPISGSMGYGLPAAIAAKLQYPDRQVIAFAGDGCLMMTVQELATAQQYGLDLIVIIVNNRKFGTIQSHQERNFPGRMIGTGLSNPDFKSLAESFGGKGEIVEDTLDFRPALTRALEHDGLALIELRTDPNA